MGQLRFAAVDAVKMDAGRSTDMWGLPEKNDL